MASLCATRRGWPLSFTTLRATGRIPMKVVPGAGLEPARHQTWHFKCHVSAYSTTRAKRKLGFVSYVRLQGEY